ncbi:MAG: hypothetical protein U0414_31790 [Polyangiaceae bacterium]
MTDKKKLRARSIARKTGMTHQAAVNALNKNLQSPAGTLSRDVAPDVIASAFRQSSMTYEAQLNLAARLDGPALHAAAAEFAVSTELAKWHQGRVLRAVENGRDPNKEDPELTAALLRVEAAQVAVVAAIKDPSTGPRQRSARIVVYCDYETSARAGAVGTFQVTELLENGRDVTWLVDQGRHWWGIEDLGQHLAKRIGQDVVLDEGS